MLIGRQMSIYSECPILVWLFKLELTLRDSRAKFPRNFIGFSYYMCLS